MGSILRALALVLALPAGAAALAQAGPPAPASLPSVPALPPHSQRPLVVDVARDPILQLAGARASFEEFRALIAAAVARHPGTQESLALSEEAEAVVDEARQRRLPSADFSVNSYRVISRAFSNDPQNIVERSRPEQRTDATLSINQTIFDFGAGKARVAAAGASLRSAAAEVESAADRVALGTIAAWYDVFAYRALVALSEAFVANQRELKASVEERVREGISAEGDVARVESYIAGAETRLARFRRQLANAEARLSELIGEAPPAAVERAPAPVAPAASREEAALAAAGAPAVRAA